MDPGRSTQQEHLATHSLWRFQRNAYSIVTDLLASLEIRHDFASVALARFLHDSLLFVWWRKICSHTLQLVVISLLKT